MRYPVLPLLGACALLLSACTAGPAQALHCGTGIVTEGDNSFDLTQRCGQPTAVTQAQGRPIATPVYDPASSRYVIQYVGQPYEIWTYNFGPTRLIARITIDNGTITKIEQDGYGY